MLISSFEFYFFLFQNVFSPQSCSCPLGLFCGVTIKSEIHENIQVNVDVVVCSFVI